ncbi:MAG TPA: N-6 DNA methylase [Candidatus Paceibacterota bacterium]
MSRKISIGNVKVVTEEDVKLKIISPILVALGYSESIENEIEYERRIPIGRGKYVFPDIVVNIVGATAFVLDAKGPEENLDFYKDQVMAYGLLLRATYSVLCNGKELRVFDTKTGKTVWSKEVTEKPDFLSKKELSAKRHTSIDSLTAEQEEQAKKTLLVFEGIKEFSTILYRCESIIRDRDGLTGADAFDELSMILFTKMYEERLAGQENRKSRFGIDEHTDARYIKKDLFERGRDANKDIFNGDESIKLKDESIKEITQLIQGYTLQETEVDVKGRAFEIFLGRTFTGKLGQFFTPRTIVDFMVSFVNPQRLSSDKTSYTVIDPSCGSGGFLIRVFMHVAKHIQETEKDNKKKQGLLNVLARDQIYGVDIDPRLVRIAKMNMVLHGDGHGGIYRNSGLEAHRHEKLAAKKFDLVITNPPFGNKDEGVILKQFELGEEYARGTPPAQLREILFVEECIKLLKDGGELAILLPDGVLNNSSTDYVRNYIKKHTIIQAVISLPDRAFKAAGANSKTSILFLRKRKSDGDRQGAVFMAVAEEVGYDRSTKEAEPIAQNDLPLILRLYREFLTTQHHRTIQDGLDGVHIIAEEPACFMIDSDLLEKRFDASYFYAKYVFKLDVPSVKIADIAYISEDRINPNNSPERVFKYIQFSHVEKRLGNIVSWDELSGEEVPSRGRLLLREGDVIAATVKDSEENVAIVPPALDGEIASTGFLVLRPKEGMTREALYVLLRLKTTFNQIRWMVSGTIQPAIKDEDYIEIVVPKLDLATIKNITKKITEVEKARQQIKYELDSIGEILLK